MLILETLPRIIFADDYHTFNSFSYDMKHYLGVSVKCKELGCNGNYVGLVYQGKYPDKKIIKKMLKDKQVEINDSFIGIYEYEKEIEE